MNQDDPRALIQAHLERAAEQLGAGNPAAALADTIRAVDLYAGIPPESRIPDAKLEAIAPLIMQNSSGELDGCGYWTTRPSFYHDAKLIRIRSEHGGPDGGSYWLLHLESKEVILPLTGIKGGVTTANSLGALNLHDGNIADYLKFYCYFEVGEEGPFLIVENLQHPVFDLDQMASSMRETIEASIQTPQVEWCNGHYEIAASLVYLHSMFRVRFSLLICSRSCEVVMVQHEKLIDDIPVRKVDWKD